MRGASVYQSVVHRNQADARGVMDARGAAASLADAFQIFLALTDQPATGSVGDMAGSTLEPACLTLRRLEGQPPAIGEPVSWQLDAPEPGNPAEAFRALLCGAQGAAWAGAVQCVGVKLGARRMKVVPEGAASLPAALALRRMAAEHCDQAGHVNVQVFLELVDDAIGVLRHQLAPGPGRLHTVSARMTFRSELFSGDVISVHSGIRACDDDGLDVVHGIVHQPSGRLACVVETRLAVLDSLGEATHHHWDLASRQSDAIQGWPALPSARPPAQPRVSCEPAPTSTVTCLAVVDAWDVDPGGWLQSRALLNWCSAGARQYLAHIGLGAARLASDRLTMAAVDYAIDVRRRPRLGSNMTFLSSHLSVGARSLRFSHHIVDSQTRLVYATVEIVGVMLDLTTHRSAEVPADVRARLN